MSARFIPTVAPVRPFPGNGARFRCFRKPLAGMKITQGFLRCRGGFPFLERLSAILGVVGILFPCPALTFRIALFCRVCEGRLRLGVLVPITPALPWQSGLHQQSLIPHLLQPMLGWPLGERLSRPRSLVRQGHRRNVFLQLDHLRNPGGIAQQVGGRILGPQQGRGEHEDTNWP